MSTIRNFFPGGNTSKGFYSYYDYIIEQDANRIFVLKGGPGVGKSSIMKKIGKHLNNIGYAVEYHHCSSDNNSLDGIVIPKLRVAMVDGTAPHIVDPKNPGAVDEIVNMGDFWDKDKVEEKKEEILSVNSEVSKCFKRAYKFLMASRPIVEDIIEKNSESMIFGKVNLAVNEFISEIFMGSPYSDKKGKIRHLFGSAYTPNGHIEYTESILSNAAKVYGIKGDYGTGKTTVLEKIFYSAIERGLDVEVLHTPLIPEKIESVYIKDIKVGITISDAFKDKNNTLNLNQYINNNIIDKYREKIEEDRKLVNELIARAIENLKEAKSLHDKLEKFYIPNMNFNDVDYLEKELINRILKYDK
ncbi:PRK06851 family protein [Clostridium sp. D2Q-11]|uniref:PRK06851 family protein n=1 Tax=Anaeromonas frigoriresistens TaxID=2683708 RepID=A0A942USH9_9FIRM|nr:PRK06851 family protein [Anaeromonas frigoriresistens]MBS4537135.1 PRK06851 family protein [Anaeromonas frigoriresistens]